MKIITTRADLVALAAELGVRPDWHEPDEQSLTARVHGTSFDNAMAPGEWWYGTGRDGVPRAELHVILYRTPSWSDYGDSEPTPLAVINLATLFAWATGHEAEDTESLTNALTLAQRDWNQLREKMQTALGVDPEQRPVPTVTAMLDRLIAGYSEADVAAGLGPEPS